MQLVLLFNAAQDRHGVFHSGFQDHHRLEPPRQSRVFFHVFAILIEGRGAHTVQFAPSQGGLDQVGRIHSAIGLTSADQRVHLVDEQDDLARSGGHFVQDSFQPFFKLAAILRTGNQGPHVEGKQALIAQGFRHIAVDDPQRQALGNRGLPDSWLADQNGVVFGATTKDLHRAANFVVAPDDGVNFASAGPFGQVLGVFLQRVIAIFCARRVRGAAFADVVDGCVERLGVHAARGQRVFGRRAHHGQRHQQPLDRDKTVARFLRQRLGLAQHFDRLLI